MLILLIHNQNCNTLTGRGHLIAGPRPCRYPRNPAGVRQRGDRPDSEHAGLARRPRVRRARGAVHEVEGPALQCLHEEAIRQPEANRQRAIHGDLSLRPAAVGCEGGRRLYEVRFTVSICPS